MNKHKPHSVSGIGAAATAQKGAVALAVAAWLPVLMGVAALAVDVSHVHVVRGEMQNDADAAALAGANALLDPATHSLDWQAATRRAQSVVRLNSAAGHTLSDAEVSTGFWNFRDEGAGLRAPPLSLTAWDVPAVSVTLRKQEGENDGPIGTFFARLWRMLGVQQQVTAVAVLSSPGQKVSPFPIALPQCLYDRYWDSSVYPPRPKSGSGFDTEFDIRFGSPLGDCGEWRWSSLLTKDNDVPVMLRLIANALADAGGKTEEAQRLAIGQDIWIQPQAVQTPVINAVKNCSVRSGNGQCGHVLMPVIQQAHPSTYQKISGFACLQILDAVTNGANSSIRVKLSNRCEAPLGGGAGPNYGVVTPSSLVR